MPEKIVLDVPSKPIACGDVTGLPTPPAGTTAAVACQDSSGNLDVVCSPPRPDCTQLGIQLGLPIGQPANSLYGSPAGSDSAAASQTIQPAPNPSESGPTNCTGPKFCLIS